MSIAGLFLLAAAVLKSQQLLSEPVMSKGFWESWEFFLIQIPLETGLAIWLLSGLFRKAAWLLTTIAFGGFICVTLGEALLGFESCGCFGTVEVNPWVTLLAIDVPIFLLLVIFRPSGCKLLPPPWPRPVHFFTVAIATFILLPVLELTLIFNKPPAKTAKYEVINAAEWLSPARKKPLIDTKKTESVPAAEPATAAESIPAAEPIPAAESVPVVRQTEAVPAANDTNQAAAAAAPNIPAAIPAAPAKKTIRWPMLKYIDIADKLNSGLWVVLMYHNNCPDCAEAVPEYEKMRQSLSGNEGAIRFAFIEMPPYAEPGHGLVSPNSVCVRGRLSDVKKWLVETPVVTVILDGGVLGAWEGYAPNMDEILAAAFSG